MTVCVFGSMASAAQMLTAANTASLETMVEMLHPDWTKKQIAEEIERLKNNERVAMMDKGILSKVEVRAAYMDETPEEARKALDEMQNEAMTQQLQQLQMAAQVQAAAQAAKGDGNATNKTTPQ